MAAAVVTGSRLLAAFAALLGLAAMAGTAGFMWFADQSLRPTGTPADAPRCDGIVALTGGAGRIETALQLLIDGRARLLLISGVQPGVDLAAIVPPSLGLNHAALARLAPRISLGHTATDTIGNAREAASWTRINDLHSLLIVTAGYHMPRAISEIAKALPDVKLQTWPVAPPALSRPLSTHAWGLLAREYVKFLIVGAGLTGSAHLREVG